MNNDDQMNSYMSTTQNYGVSCSNDMSSESGGFYVESTSSLLKAALFIVSQGSYRYNYISTRTQHSIDRLIDEFDDITNRKENSFEFYRGLIETYENLFGIYLCLIADYGGTYTIVDRSYFPDTNKQQFNQNPYAFIYYNMKENKYSPLYKEMDGCISTIFSAFDNSVWNHAQSFVDQLNKNVIYSNQNQADHLYNLREEDPNHMVIDDTHATTNQPSESTIEHEIISTASAVIEQMVQEIVQLIPNFGARLDSIVYQNDIVGFEIKNLNQMLPKNTGELIQQRLLVISNIVEMAAINPVSQNDNETMSSTVVTEDQSQLDQSNLLTNLSSTTNVSQSRHATTSTPLRWKSPPEIITQPKPTWDYRTMRDLWKKELPLLAGIGSQRTPIRVKIPSKSDGPMHLVVEVVNLNQEKHCSKVVVPEHTSVNMKHFIKDDDLSRLVFDVRNQNDYFDPVNKKVYLTIKSDDHRKGKKDVRIRMFNLYQSGTITKDKIRDEQLDKCRLAFWFCIRENGEYKTISDVSFSNVITEKKKEAAK